MGHSILEPFPRAGGLETLSHLYGKPVADVQGDGPDGYTQGQIALRRRSGVSYLLGQGVDVIRPQAQRPYYTLAQAIGIGAALLSTKLYITQASDEDVAFVSFAI